MICVYHPFFLQLVEEKRAEHWRSNCPELRQAEVQQREKAMHSTWKEQINHRTEVAISRGDVLRDSTALLLSPSPCLFLPPTGGGVC